MPLLLKSTAWLCLVEAQRAPELWIRRTLARRRRIARQHRAAFWVGGAATARLQMPLADMLERLWGQWDMPTAWSGRRLVSPARAAMSRSPEIAGSKSQAR